ncbi:MAG: hypothetical protein E6J91_21465 [Deltaproteobacteria bacterium]|nr:MAG: hypothetical protein E6J91_21465 [Deltaproteobacteria bacterium]
MIDCGCRERHEARRIVLTGGPGAGKTAVLALLQQSLCQHLRVLHGRANTRDLHDHIASAIVRDVPQMLAAHARQAHRQRRSTIPRSRTAAATRRCLSSGERWLSPERPNGRPS